MTSPEELVAAAYAACFSMALSEHLGHAGFYTDLIHTTATVTSEQLPEGWTMTRILLDVVARVPRARSSDFIDAALRAKTRCTISLLITAIVSMKAKLEMQ